MNCKKGDIIEGTNRSEDAAFHYIVYLKPKDSEAFIGAMLTHSSQKGNIQMQAEHFKKSNKKGQAYKVYYDDTCFVKGKFIKPETWGPYKKVGELTEAGITFIESHTNTCVPIFWKDK